MSVSDFLAFTKKNKNISPKIRLYLIDKDKHYFINAGTLKNGFSPKLTIANNRDSVLSAFSKMAFLFDELIRLRIVGHSNESDSSELLYLLNLVPINRKIRTFLDWKVFGPEFTRDMSRLFEVRNDTVHCISLDEVTYHPKSKVSLSSMSGFKKFRTDFQKAWKTLLEIYVTEQEKLDFKKLSMG
ncbi:hypothetical protein NKOR_05000 [Candidatus Nitrosopumilus koreensis AR1]|uniref:Apea-like HEPN domain-containing protein n=1 Tax=Candidatus Nitrosopumilus koreensis AR1 TaxID=1229908 RepID=K0B8Z3_9ARCH|nr:MULTISPECIES: hypothetical protein [Nitrosopumilus]AFS80886.1 hypothetical protein NKOR_05000 [Candidatus Nitrosopumilus koreensis AR1]